MERDNLTKAFLELYAKHQREIYVYLRAHIPTGSDIDDVFQDSCLVLWEKFDQYRPETNFRAWAFSVVRLRILKYYERQNRFSQLLNPEVAALLAKEFQAVGETVGWRVEALRNCLEKLQPQEKLLLQQRYESTKTVREISQKLHRTESAVYKTLNKIHRSLFNCVKTQLFRRASP